jgi:hypothetical protein
MQLSGKKFINLKMIDMKNEKPSSNKELLKLFLKQGAQLGSALFYMGIALCLVSYEAYSVLLLCAFGLICVIYTMLVTEENKNTPESFPKFWFEGNLFFDWVVNLDDLQKVFDAHKGFLTKDEVLDKAVNKDEKLNEFGLRYEHKGNVTLRQFLVDHGIEI